MEPESKQLIGLPLSVVGPTDVGRLQRELEAIDNYLREQRLRVTGETAKLPKTSRLMDQTVELNKLDLLQQADRQNLQQYLQMAHTQAPRLHISFGADPTPYFMQKLMFWLRGQIGPNVLVVIGLQPSIGAGCIVRTTNKQFDFSLGKHLAEHRDLLLARLREGDGAA